MGYADAHGIEGDTDEPDESHATQAAKPKPKPKQAKAPPAPPPPPPVNPVAEARRHLAGEVVDDDTLDLDLVDTLEIREMLNARPPGDRGKVRAVLVKHGYDLPLPNQMKAGPYQALQNLVTAELADIDEATT
jgi:type IV secretory pathway VirB10-like protein